MQTANVRVQLILLHRVLPLRLVLFQTLFQALFHEACRRRRTWTGSGARSHPSTHVSRFRVPGWTRWCCQRYRLPTVDPVLVYSSRARSRSRVGWWSVEIRWSCGSGLLLLDVVLGLQSQELEDSGQAKPQADLNGR
jgi:hypothetical protein